MRLHFAFMLFVWVLCDRSIAGAFAPCATVELSDADIAKRKSKLGVRSGSGEAPRCSSGLRVDVAPQAR